MRHDFRRRTPRKRLASFPGPAGLPLPLPAQTQSVQFLSPSVSNGHVSSASSLSLPHLMSHLSREQGQERGGRGRGRERMAKSFDTRRRLQTFGIPFLPPTRVGLTSRPPLSSSFSAFFRAEKCLCEWRNCQWPYGTNERRTEGRREAAKRGVLV